jgi:hypothetical protein
MNRDDMSYLDHLARATGDREKAERIIKIAKDPLYGITGIKGTGSWAKYRNKKARLAATTHE